VTNIVVEIIAGSISWILALCCLSSTLVVIGDSSGREVRAARRNDERVENVTRTLEHDHPAIQQALMVLGQAVNPVPVIGAAEIRDLYLRMSGGSPPTGLNAFRARSAITEPNIYVNSDSAVFRAAAAKPSAVAILKLAATLAHEQVHNTDGDLAAYRLQSDFIRSKLGTVPKRQREEARAYLESIESKAVAISYATRRQQRVIPNAGAERGRASRS
jgi:hypothetical protein